MGRKPYFRRLRRYPMQKLACFQRVKAMSLFHQKIHDQLEDTFDVLESVAIGLCHTDRVEYALMCVGMNCPLECILWFAPSFRKASRASCCVHLAASCSLNPLHMASQLQQCSCFHVLNKDHWPGWPTHRSGSGTELRLFGER